MLRFFQEHEVDQVYAYEMLQKFAMSLIGIFIPIYIASSGSPIQWIFLYLLVYSGVFTAVSLPVSYLIARIGFKHSLVASYFFYLPAFFLLRSYGLSLELVVLTGGFIGLGKALHWIPLHAEFAVDTQEKTRGKSSGRLLGLPRLSKALAPFIGGAVMAAYGFPLLAAVTIAVFILSAVPLMASRDHRDPMKYDLRKMFDLEHIKLGSMFILRGVTISTGAFLFPLYVFYVAGGTVNAGGASSLANLGSMFFALAVGTVTDRVEKKHMILIGVVASSVLFALRAYVSTPVEAFLVSFVAGLMFMVYYVPLFSSLADIASDEDVLEFYAFRETFLGFGKLTVLLVALYAALQKGVVAGLKTSFYVAAAATLLLSGYARMEKIK